MSETPRRDSPGGSFHDHYESLVERAAAGAALPPGGMTPREQCRALEDSGVASPEMLRRLSALLERCVYGQAGNEQEHREGIALCTEAASGLPLPERDLHAQRHRRDWFRWLRAAWPVLAPILALLAVIALAVGVGFALTRMSFPSGGGSGGGGSTASSSSGARSGGTATSTGGSSGASDWKAYAAERQAAYGRDDGWAKPPSNPTYQSIDPPRALPDQSRSRAADPTLDQTTGVDADAGGVPDPFSPPLSFTHRLFAYEDVTATYVYRGARLDSLRPEALATPDEAAALRATYTVTVALDAQRDTMVPIPSPSADARVVSISDSSLALFRDDADMLYAQCGQRGVHDVTYTIGTPGDYSFAPLPGPDVPFIPEPQPLPANVRADAEVVLDVIGAIPGPSYTATVRRLHQYCAGFSVCPLEADDIRANDFLTLALARKGVCRHRARVFFVLARAAGIPTRLVENRVHSFCEIRLPDGTWRRMEFRLGVDEGAPNAARSTTGSDQGTGHGTGPIARPTPGTRPALLIGLILGGLVFVLLGAAALWWLRTTTARHGIAMIDAAAAPPRGRRDDPAHTLDALQGVTHALVVQVRHRAGYRFGAAPDDTEALRAVVDRTPMPERARRGFAGVFDAPAPEQLAPDDIESLYWSCWHVLQWLEETARDSQRTN